LLHLRIGVDAYSLRLYNHRQRAMRLEPQHREAIVRTIRAYDPDATVYLFGSRVDDGARGGDIDLLVISQRLTREQLIDAKLDLYDQLGEQKIDLLVTDTPRTAIERIARKEGVPL